MSSTHRHTCALASGKVYCWGDNRNHQIEVPEDLDPVVSIVTSPGYSCAATAKQVRCWGLTSQIPVDLFNAKFENIKQLSTRFSDFCVLDGVKVQCFSKNGKIVAVPNDLGPATEVKVEVMYACAKVGDKFRCWGDSPQIYSFILNPSEGTDVTDFESNKGWGGLQCTIANNFPNCDWRSAPSDIIGAEKVAVAYAHKSACASTYEGVRCWGDMYDEILKYPISPDIQNVGKRVNDTALDGFLGCYSRGYKIERVPYQFQGAMYENVMLTNTDDDWRIIATSLTDDILKAIPGKELRIISQTDAAKSRNVKSSLRMFKKTDGTWVLSSPYGWAWNLTKENCK